MVQLIGVTPNVIQEGVIIGMDELDIFPTIKSSKTFKKLPRNSKIGIASLNPNDLEEVNEHAIEAFEGISGIKLLPNRYWETLAEDCQKHGHQVIWLEDKEQLKKYYEALAIQKKLDMAEIFTKENESKRKYRKRLILFNEQRHSAEVSSRKIYLIDRYHTLLQNIAKNNCTLVIEKFGITDIWMQNRQQIQKKYGIKLDTNYHAELFTRKNGLRFIQHHTPNPQLKLQHLLLQRAIRLMESGKLTERSQNPDFVGVWKHFYCPSQGYFEVFIEKRNSDGSLEGTIEDTIGTATFEGIISPTKIDIVKRYTTNAAPNHAKRDIKYTSKATSENQAIGSYKSDNADGIFYLEPFQRTSPSEMGLRWFDLENK